MFWRKKPPRQWARIVYPPNVEELFIKFGNEVRIVIPDTCVVEILEEMPDGRLRIAVDVGGIPLRVPIVREQVKRIP